MDYTCLFPFWQTIPSTYLGCCQVPMRVAQGGFGCRMIDQNPTGFSSSSGKLKKREDPQREHVQGPGEKVQPWPVTRAVRSDAKDTPAAYSRPSACIRSLRLKSTTILPPMSNTGETRSPPVQRRTCASASGSARTLISV